VGLFGQIEPTVAKRTTTDATATDVQTEGGGERLGAKKDEESE